MMWPVQDGGAVARDTPRCAPGLEEGGIPEVRLRCPSTNAPCRELTERPVGQRFPAAGSGLAAAGAGPIVPIYGSRMRKGIPMRHPKIVLAGIALCWCAAPARADTHEPTLRDKQQAACYNDVMKYCAEFVPDVDRVTACMAPKRKLVSPGCAAFYPNRR